MEIDRSWRLIMKKNEVRENLEKREELLSPYALQSVNSTRDIPEEKSSIRTEFQRDRDRIIHTNAFRRLKHKSQVFVAPQGDHFTTRLSHVIEVSQVARTIARALNLNEDLVEAIGLGHDLGHTPFGHIGESVLNSLLPGGFHHSRHSVRIVNILEKQGKGLNLTHQVIDGIRNHSKPEGEFISLKAVEGLSLEAQIVRISDALAYLAHDILDALRSGFFVVSDLPNDSRDMLGAKHSQRISKMVHDVIESSRDCIGTTKKNGSKPWIRMSDELKAVITDLRNFMFERFYHPISSSKEGQQAAGIVELLFNHYVSNTEDVPLWIRDLSKVSERASADMVCGMTDNYALIIAEELKPGISDGVFQGRI